MSTPTDQLPSGHLPSEHLKFHWFLPTGGDGHHVGGVTAVQRRTAAASRRAPSLDYLSQVAHAAELAGFEAALTPTGAGCEDSLVTCAALAPVTSTLRFLVAFRPSLTLPTVLAQQAATFQRISGDRLALNVVTGGDPTEQRAFGDFSDHDARYRRTDEFLTILRGLFAGRTVDFDGEFLRVEQAKLVAPPEVTPHIYFGGASAVAEEVAARHADTYLTWGEPLDLVGPRLDRVRALAAANARRPRFGIRLHIISRDTSAEAWAEAERLLEGMDDAAIEASQQRFARMDSVGQSRMTALHGGERRGRARELEVAPNLWAGIGLVREGAATALVGDHDEVAARLAEYHHAGFDEFILSGYPHLEEALRFGEQVRPRVDAALRPLAAVGA